MGLPGNMAVWIVRAIMGGLADEERIHTEDYDPFMAFIPIFLLLIDLYLYDSPLHL